MQEDKSLGDVSRLSLRKWFGFALLNVGIDQDMYDMDTLRPKFPCQHLRKSALSELAGCQIQMSSAGNDRGS